MSFAPVAEQAGIPVFDGDLWSDDAIRNPYPLYQVLRELGPVVRLSRQGAWAATRYDAVREVLVNGEVFSSARGCTMNEPMNAAFAGVMLCSDDPRHREMRRVFAKPLMPAALAPLKARLAELATARIEELVAGGQFDAVPKLAHFLPLTVVTELVGLSDEGKAKMLEWAAGVFNAFGPLPHARTDAGIEVTQQAFVYLTGVDRNELAPGGWGAALFEAADRGQVDHQQAQTMLMDYLAPSLDTTINATSAIIRQFALNPAEWDKVRADPALISSAIDEVVRIEAPIRGFTRHVTRDHLLGDVPLAAGDRVLALYASANRDERHYPDPDRFDVTRRVRDHVGFGYGTHICAGMHLAKLELTVLLETLVPRVKRFRVLAEEWAMNNTLRGLSRLSIAVDPA